MVHIISFIVRPLSALLSTNMSSCKELGSRASENNVISFLNLNIWVSGYVSKIWVVMDRIYVCPKRVINRRYFVLHFSLLLVELLTNVLEVNLDLRGEMELLTPIHVKCLDFCFLSNVSCFLFSHILHK